MCHDIVPSSTPENPLRDPINGSQHFDRETPPLLGRTHGTSSCIKGKEKSVPKLKTNRGAAKRFKKTGTGKIKVKRAFARHILTSKPAGRKRHLRSPKLVDPSDARGIKKLVPYI